MSGDVITEESIKELVDRFYTKVRADAELGPVFGGAIGENDQDWEPHLERMYAFWSSVMLTSGRYHGNPMQKHKDLPHFDESLFDTWLALFAETAHEIHDAVIAERYIGRSQSIAESLKLGLYYKPERMRK